MSTFAYHEIFSVLRSSGTSFFLGHSIDVSKFYVFVVSRHFVLLIKKVATWLERQRFLIWCLRVVFSLRQESGVKAYSTKFRAEILSNLDSCFTVIIVHGVRICTRESPSGVVVAVSDRGKANRHFYVIR